MSKLVTSFVLVASAAGAAAFGELALAGDPPVPAAPVPAASVPAPAAEAEAPEVPAAERPTTPSPLLSMWRWVGAKARAGGCGDPTTPEGEASWRAWFAGGADVPLAGLRDALLADGWTADRFVPFFHAAKRKAEAVKAARAARAAGDAAPAGKACGCGGGDGCCKGTGVRADGKPCCGGCKPAATSDARKADAPKADGATPVAPTSQGQEAEGQRPESPEPEAAAPVAPTSSTDPK